MNHLVDGSEIRRLPVKVGSFSHYLQFFFFASSQVVGLGISEAVSNHFSMIMIAWPRLNSLR